jgi:DNA anti-recombination protein RmuC
MNQLMSQDQVEKPDRLHQIRDIIVGPQLRELNRRLEKIESDLLTLQEEMHHRMDETRNALSKELHIAVESLTRKIGSLSLATQQEWTDLRQQFEQAEARLSDRLKTLDREVDAGTTSLRKEFSQTLAKFREEMQNLRTQIHEELDRRLSVLEEAGISKDEMAEILFELGMKLKGAEFVSDPTYSPIV